MKIVDNAIAARIIYLLTLPFVKWKAFNEGIIDADGGLLDNKIDSDNWTMLHRLVWRLKLMLAKIPGGSSQLASLAAAVALVKECVDKNIEPENLEQIFEEGETPTNNTSGVQNKDNPIALGGGKKIIKRKTLKDYVKSSRPTKSN